MVTYDENLKVLKETENPNRRCFAGEDVGEFAQVLVVREEELEKYKEASGGYTLNPKPET